jgi:tight adherence protein C
MSFTILSVILQLIVAAFCGLSVSYGLRKFASYRQRPEVKAAEQDVLSWPAPFPRLSPFVGSLLPSLQRFIHPSGRVHHELRIVGQPSGFDDRQFLKMRYVLGLIGVVAGLMLLSVAALLTHTSTQFAFHVLPILLGLGGFFLPRISLRDRSAAVLNRIRRGFPSFLDVFALTLESGQNFQSALMLSVQNLSEPSGHDGLKTQLQEVLRSVRAGQSRIQALQQLSDRLALPEFVQFVASIAASEKQGVSVTTLLRRQSEQLRISRALAAERHAMKLPVKLLAPLAICIFPCTFLVLAFPIGVQLLNSGIF